MHVTHNSLPSSHAASTVDLTNPRLFAFGLVTLLGLSLCVVLAYPFLPALAWALALAVMAFPMHLKLARVIRSESCAAGASTAVVVAVLLIPMFFIGERLAQEAVEVSRRATVLRQDRSVEEAAERLPYGRQAIEWVRQTVDIESEAHVAIRQIAGRMPALAQGSSWLAIQLLVCVFALYYAFRDWRHLLGSMRGLSPLTRSETDYLFHRVSDSIHATVYATVVTSVIQGASGGLLFWCLGIPGPVLWAVVMIILGILPIIGAGLVWVPAAVVLAVDDRWGAAVVVVVWGLFMAGVVGNYYYAYLAGDRMRLHEVPVLVAFVGGLAVFGVSGMVIGPAVLAITMGMLDVWRQRMDPEGRAIPTNASEGSPTNVEPRNMVRPTSAN